MAAQITAAATADVPPLINNDKADGAGDDGDALPFPDGRFALTHLSRTQLSEWCKTYKLPYSGTIAVLKARLVEFSALGKQGWDQHLATGARRCHRGPREGPTKAAPKKSAKRRNDLFSADMAASGSSTQPPSASSNHHHLLLKKEDKGMVSWAERIMERCPYRPPASSMAAATTARVHVTARTTSLPAEYEQKLTELNANVSQLTQMLSSATQGSPAGTSSMALTTFAPSPHCALFAGAVTTGSGLSSAVSAASETVLPPTPASALSSLAPSPTLTLSALPASTASMQVSTREDRVRVLKLGNGQKLRFMQSEIPDPPAVSFAKNIPELHRMWDETSFVWANESYLRIQGHPIPVRLWPEVYKYGKSGQWKGTKTKWGEWKAVVERWREGTPEEFWAEFSVEGKYLSWAAIVKRLAAERAMEDKEIVKRARLEYGDSFGTAFEYRKGSSHSVMQNPTKIACRYRKLHSIAQ